MNDPAPEATPAPRRILGLTPLGLSVVGALCLFSVTVYGGCFASFFSSASEMTSATPLVEKYMRLMAAHNSAAAESLFSQEIDPYDTKRELDAMLRGPNYVLFEGYRSLNSEGGSFFHRQGCLTNTSTLNVQGPISYEDGTVGHFTAQMVRERDAWALLGVSVVVPPAKILHSKPSDDAPLP